MKITWFDWEGGIKDSTPRTTEVSASLLRQFEEHVYTCGDCGSDELDWDADGYICIPCTRAEDDMEDS